MQIKFKTWLGSQMGKSWLTGLAFMDTHRNTNIDMNTTNDSCVKVKQNFIFMI